MNPSQISNSEAVDIVLNSQLLNGELKQLKGRTGLPGIINHLGYIQIDTISVITRAHHHILWTRKKDYKEKQLHDLQTKDKLIFEYWTHAMSFIPMDDYRYSIPRMLNFRHPKSKWLKYRYNQSKNYLASVLERIRNEGPLSSSDFENDSGKKGGTWWQWKPSKTALEYLFWLGDLMVAERKSFKKYYDIKERVLPANINQTIPGKDELSRYFILRALRALGVASEKEIFKFMQPGKANVSDLQVVDRETMKKTLKDMIHSAEILPLIIDGDHKLLNYMLPENVNRKVKQSRSFSDVHLLSPFDNLIIQRERTRRLFNFDYAIEFYLPVQKRKFGYFTLPILWGKRFVGRMDPKADRLTKKLIINNIVFENLSKDYDELLNLLSKKLNSFAEFNGCEKVVVQKCTPKPFKKLLQLYIKENRQKS